MAVTTVTTTMAGAINYTVVTDTSADWAAVPNSTYFYDKAIVEAAGAKCTELLNN